MKTAIAYSRHEFSPMKWWTIASLFVCSLLALSQLLLAQQASPGDWKSESQRKEIAPLFSIDKQTNYNGNPTLVIAGGGKDYADGHWYKTVDVEPGKYFSFQAYFLPTKVDEPDRSVLARIIWQNASAQKIGEAEYPATLIDKKKDGWNIIEQTYKVPGQAKKARIELQYRWDGDGMVNFGGISFQPTNTPAPRTVRLATVYLRPRNSASSQENLDKFAQQVEKAAAENADIVCLPEALTLVGTKLNYVSASEPIPGPSTKFLGELAKKHHLYIVAGILEKEGVVVYNTAVLLDRNGNLAGKYRKVSLPREEIEGGVTPGNSFPVFDTDFGRIGLMICWDVTFPEAARSLAMKGAEVIFLPLAGGNLTLTKARAIENQVYLVSSTYDMISAVFDQEGEVMKQATDKDPVVVVSVDLNKQKLWEWLGDLKNRIPREIPSQKAIAVTRER